LPLHVVKHLPPLQTVPDTHAVLAFAVEHPPQFALSDAMSVQPEAQASEPLPQLCMHTPLLQDSPVPQAWSQVPQLFESVFRSKQPLPHWVIAPPSPPVQLSAQVPFKHTRPVPQVEPHVPQLSALVERSTHLPSHDIFPPEHVDPVIESP
jgi:hypothetical protein